MNSVIPVYEHEAVMEVCREVDARERRHTISALDNPDEFAEWFRDTFVKPLCAKIDREMTEPTRQRFVQIQNPRTGTWGVVDTEKGVFVEQGMEKPLANIKVRWRGRLGCTEPSPRTEQPVFTGSKRAIRET